MLYVHEANADGGFNARKVDEVLCYTKTKYQTVLIVKHSNLGRTLYLGNDTNLYFQSDDSFQHDYHDEMVRLALLVAKEPIFKVLICGSGPGGLEKACRRVFIGAEIQPLELDGEAAKLYNQYLPDWGCVISKVRYGDIFRWIPTYKDGEFQAVFWDIDADAIIGDFEVGDQLKRILTPNGVFVATAGAIQERAKHDPYTRFLKELNQCFPEGNISAFNRMNWNFFYAANKGAK